ncbi:MAG: FlgO family outer membrane protein [candidate division Zixibacteria bacterium]|nr:FlgO family outer membrane protein [candidate division Zixibacteria bacterium]MDH3935909.1 FlgO family outer membrane protein [candidate division Zixibacteria bacterium]MDH4032824.1 FlgO family outer membrane protein [candidate division Zixibacteria bacterium]
MSSCSQKRFQSMLHHYELKLLSDDEQLQFEAHLLECDHCLEEVKRFQRVARLMTHDVDVRDTVRKLDDGVTVEPELASQKSWFSWSRLVPTSAIAVVVLVFLVLKDWQVDIRPSQEAFAVENRLAVMPFENMSDSEDADRMGEIATNLLITDLSQSRFVQVLSSQSLDDILQKAGADSEADTEAVPLEAARKAQAQWMLQGAIVQTEPSVIVTTQLIEVADGAIVASHRVDGQPGEDVFAVIDRLTVEIKSDLSLPSDAKREEDRSIADVTTNSVDAYKYYIDGMRYQASFYAKEAIAAFHRALEYDSTFAMVYYYLAEIENRNLIEQAVLYSEGASWKEQRYILAKQAATAYDNNGAIAYLKEIIERFPDEKNALMRLAMNEYAMARFDEAAEHFMDVVRIDPDDKGAFNQLAYTFSAMENLDSAIWAANKYIELAPDEANPYDSRGDLYAVRGKLDEAIESFKMALEVKPDFYASLEKLGHMYVFQGEHERADSVYRRLEQLDDDALRSWSRYFLAYGTLRRGRRREALGILDQGIVRCRDENLLHEQCHLYRMKALIYEDMGQFDRALIELDSCFAFYALKYPNDHLSFQDIRARLLAQLGEHDKALQVTEQLRRTLIDRGARLGRYDYAAAITAWYRGDEDEALIFADKYAPTYENKFGYGRRYTLARLYFDAGRLEDAITEFENQVRDLECSRLYWGAFNVRTYYYLGRAYEQSHWYERAIAQYRTFLELWGSGDEDIEEINDARERLARLESES